MRRVVATTIALVALSLPVKAVAQTQPLPEQCDKWRKTFHRYFPRDEVPRADRATLMRVMYRESRCIAQATGFNYVKPYTAADCTRAHWRTYIKTCKHLRPYGRGVDWGLMQVNGSWRTVTVQICGRPPETGVLLDPGCNLRVARWLYDNGGMGHWAGQSGDGK